MKIPLSRIAHTRSGDKGDTANIGVIAFDECDYDVLVREVTAARVKEFFGELVKGVGQDGCGLEAQLESVYRFLVQPDPWTEIAVTGDVP